MKKKQYTHTTYITNDTQYTSKRTMMIQHKVWAIIGYGLCACMFVCDERTVFFSSGFEVMFVMI